MGRMYHDNKKLTADSCSLLFNLSPLGPFRAFHQNAQKPLGTRFNEPMCTQDTSHEYCGRELGERGLQNSDKFPLTAKSFICYLILADSAE